MKRVLASANLAEVHHAKNLLDTIGIRAFLKNEMLASGIGELPFADCQPELWVADDADAERARQMLAEGLLPAAEKNVRWQCACGEISEAQFTQCWRCGSYRNS